MLTTASSRPKPLSIQLYTLREAAAKDFPAVLKRVADIGFAGVEPAGFHSYGTAKAFRRAADDLGLVVSSTHSPWAQPGNLNQVIDDCGVLGTTFVAGGYGPDEFKTLDAITRTAETVAGMTATLAKAGITLALHNHWWEFEKLDGRITYEIFAERCPTASFELDTYWAANFGANASPDMVRRFAKRSPLLHIKDGSFVKDAPLLTVGAGRNDIPGIVAAMDPAVTRWLVLEQDSTAGDMFADVEAGYRYLTSRKLAAGKR